MVEHDKDDGIEDFSLNQILDLASAPVLSTGFEDRVMAALERQTATSATIIAFPKRKSANAWLMGVPLAACLMLGVFFGASGDFSDVLPSLSATTLTASADQLSSTGFDDIENLSAGDQS